MRKYVGYCTSMADDDSVSFGLGDLCHVDNARIADVALTSTGYYYLDCLLLSRFADLTGRASDRAHYTDLATRIRTAFNRRFYHGDGIYCKGEQTAIACALHQGMVEDAERDKAVAALVRAVEASDRKPDFGILGAKYVPRALAENGHADLAYHLITQPEYPGWGHWLTQGATTLWEDWGGKSSRNHIMFGDISAWMYQYLGGLAPDPEKPGFKHVRVKPCPVHGVEWVRAEHVAPMGRIVSAWTAKDGAFELHLEIPYGCTATVSLPDGSVQRVNVGQSHYTSHC